MKKTSVQFFDMTLTRRDILGVHNIVAALGTNEHRDRSYTQRECCAWALEGSTKSVWIKTRHGVS